MAKFCKLCGTPCEEGAKFCTECGAVLISSINTSSETPRSFDTQPPKNEEPMGFTEVNEEKPVETVDGNSETASNDDEVVENKNSYTENNYGSPNNYDPYGGSGYDPVVNNNPYGGSNYNSPNGSNPYGGSNYGSPNGGNQYSGGAQGNPYVNYQAPVQQNRPVNGGLMIFSIINTLIGCCTCSGIIFGIAALVFTVLAKNQPTDEDYEKYNKVSWVLNIVGVISTVLVIVGCVAYSILLMESAGGY